MLNIIKHIVKKLRRRLGKPYIITNSILDGNNTFGANTVIVNSSIGCYTYFGAYCSIYETLIGRYCCIGNNVKVIAAQHPTNYISVHPFFYMKSYGNVVESQFSNYKYLSNSQLPPPEKTNDSPGVSTTDNQHLRAIIGHDVWIGDDVKISGGVKIGTGAIIGMGAVVTKDVPPYAIVGGVPARIIRYRFDEATIKKLIESEWWNVSETILRNLVQYAKSPIDFIEHMQNALNK